VTDETLLTSMFAPFRAPNLYAPGEDDGLLPRHVWSGLLGEFRNQLERLNAGTVQLRDALPVDVCGDMAPALSDMEASLDGLFGLVSCLDTITVVGTGAGQQVISDLADVIDRAVAMAQPWLRADVRVTVGNRVGAVRNRGRAVECALAAVIVTLGRPDDAVPGVAPARGLHVEVFSSRGAVSVEVEVLGASIAPAAAPAPSPLWRWRLAERLAAVAGGSLEPLPDRSGAGLRFQ
jgi:hypothetical protein